MESQRLMPQSFIRQSFIRWTKILNLIHHFKHIFGNRLIPLTSWRVDLDLQRPSLRLCCKGAPMYSFSFCFSYPLYLASAPWGFLRAACRPVSSNRSYSFSSQRSFQCLTSRLQPAFRRFSFRQLLWPFSHRLVLPDTISFVFFVILACEVFFLPLTFLF